MLNIRLLPEHDALIRKAAESAGISLSDWIRERLLRAARKEVSQMVQPKYQVDACVRFMGENCRVGNVEEKNGTFFYSIHGASIDWPSVAEGELRPCRSSHVKSTQEPE